jgi:hypothetical protein
LSIIATTTQAFKEHQSMKRLKIRWNSVLLETRQTKFWPYDIGPTTSARGGNDGSKRAGEGRSSSAPSRESIEANSRFARPRKWRRSELLQKKLAMACKRIHSSYRGIQKVI